eukprot:TRINITY_DN10749_c0_g1_i3.p1 TRINITY_DN10749_c0_g1~~TRINITY_DN10749_c0_g1_i3.p1  ORF type:complete len:213 (-),score=45.16 TRINITY_DN10749_c0_g1_i3:339-977(-)
METIANKLGYFFFFGKAHGENYGNGILSKIPPISMKNYPLSVKGKEGRSCVGILIPHPSKNGEGINIYCTHLHHVDEETRVQQLEQCLNVLERDKDSIWVGDFNSLVREDYEEDFFLEKILLVRQRGCWEIPRFEVTRKIQEFYVDCLRICHPENRDENIVTCSYNTRVDYVWGSLSVRESIDWYKSNVLILSSEVVSDHFPLLANFFFLER